MPPDEEWRFADINQPMQPHDYPPDLEKVVAEQQARIEWLEKVLRATIGVPNIHDGNYTEVSKLLRNWPYNPRNKEQTK